MYIYLKLHNCYSRERYRPRPFSPTVREKYIESHVPGGRGHDDKFPAEAVDNFSPVIVVKSMLIARDQREDGSRQCSAVGGQEAAATVAVVVAVARWRKETRRVRGINGDGL